MLTFQDHSRLWGAVGGDGPGCLEARRCRILTGHVIFLLPLGFTPVLLMVASHHGALRKLSASKAALSSAYAPPWERGRAGTGSPRCLPDAVHTGCGEKKAAFHGHIRRTWAALEPVTL